MAVKTPHQNVTFDSVDGEAHGYLAVPESGRGPGVIVIQEWWGLTDHIRDVADRLAAEGFVALAPDLFGGWITHDGDEAAKMMSELPEAEAPGCWPEPWTTCWGARRSPPPRSVRSASAWVVASC